MKRLSLNIIFLLGFFLVTTEAYGQEKETVAHQRWNDFHQEIADGSLNEVKTSFDEFAEWTMQHQQDSLLMEGILTIVDYYKEQREFGERIRWYQFALDSLCKNRNSRCIEVRRDFANIYSLIEQYDKANTLLLDNLDFFKKIDFKDAISLENSSIAKNHLRNGNYDKAEKFYFNALSAAQEGNSSFYIILSYNNLGFFFSRMADFKTAEEYYLKGINLLENKDSLSQQQQAQLALLKGNLGGNYIKFKEKVKKGEAFLKEDIRYNFKEGVTELSINATAELAGHYYKNKAYKKANSVLQFCIQEMKRRAENIENNVNLVPIYYLLFKVHLEQQQNQKALHYFNIYDALKETRDNLRDQQRSNIEKSLMESILNVQLNYQEQQIQLKDKENEMLEEKNKNFFYRLLIGLFSFLILAILIFLYSRKRISLMRINKELAEQKFEVERLEKQKAKIELNYKNKDLTDFAIDISRKQEVLTEIKAKLNEIIKGKWNEEAVHKAIKTLIRYSNNNLLVDDQLKEFQENVEEVNYKFLDQLGKRYPELTELDKNICGLIRLGLSNKEIATMRNVSYKAIRMSRYRIRKKLGIATEVDLVEFLKSIE